MDIKILGNLLRETIDRGNLRKFLEIGSRPFFARTLCCSRAQRALFCAFLPSVRRGFMPRRGWTAAPDGWVQFIRGPRPPAQRWPMAQGNRQPPQGKVAERAAVVFGGQVSGEPIVRGRRRSDVPPVGSNPVAALERALAALGPEDAGAKAGLQAALERAKQKAKVAPSRAPAPEVTIDAARVRVARLEAALSALADHTGPEVDALTAALARARIAASPPPVDVQVTQCQQFIERAVKRIDDLDKAREVEAVRLQEARDRLQRLQQEAAATTATVPPAGVPDAAAEVVHLRGMVSQLQAKLAMGEGGFAGPAMDVVIQEVPTKKRPRPECFVSQTVEELIEWLDGRQSDMRVAVEAGNAPEVGRLAVLLAEGSAQLKSWTLNPSMASNTVS